MPPGTPSITPKSQFGDVVPGVCIYCHTAIAVGDPVLTRRLVSEFNPIHPDQSGTVARILANPKHGTLYVVQLTAGRSITCPRSALRKDDRPRA